MGNDKKCPGLSLIMENAIISNGTSTFMKIREIALEIIQLALISFYLMI